MEKKRRLVDIGSIKKILLAENEFIIDLWKKLPIPASAQQYISDVGDDETNDNKEKVKLSTKLSKKTSRARSLEELHEKLEKLKGKRLVYKDRLLKKGLKNRLTKKRKKEANNLRKKLSKQTNLNQIQSDKSVKPVKQIFNGEGKMVFNKFDFSESGHQSEPNFKKNKDEKDPKKILQKLGKQNERIKKLELEGQKEKASAIKETTAWKSAILKAEGVKVKDDPELLKKSVRKNVERKRRSKKLWQAREEKVKQQQQDKQTKRTENIQARKKQVKLKKMKKAAKKGRIIPGF